MILVVNTGSSSLKFKLFNSNLGVEKSAEFVIGKVARDHLQATNLMLTEIGKQKDEIEKVGYRVVHGGDEVEEVMPITLAVIKIIEKYSSFAPEHNLPAEKVIRNLIEKIPLSSHFAVFDTAFFKDLPDVTKIYPIDRTISEELHIRRFGFHGISHEFAMMAVDPEHKKKVITIHLGAGSSLAAINCGKPIDTSMGFTPLEGVAMQNRSGDLDPGVIFYLIDEYGYKKAREIVENNSGLAGISGTSGDMLELLEREDEMSKLAIEIFCYRIKKYLGGYIATLGGIDLVVFTGKIGFGSEVIRNKILDDIKFADFIVKTVEPDEELAIAKKL